YRFKPHLSVCPVGQERVFLLGERERFMLRGRLYRIVAPLVDGRRTLGELIEALDGQAAPPEVYHALTMLEERGYLTEAGRTLSPEAEAFWHALGKDPRTIAEKVAATPVLVQAIRGLDPEPLCQALSAAGVVVVREQAAVRVVVTDDYLASDL